MRLAPSETKAWGTVRHVFNDSAAAVSILETVAGTFCSRHSHAQRVNRFAVQSGAIQVVEYSADGREEVSRVSLGAGDVHDVEADVVHRFEVVESGIVVEVYFPARPGDRVSADDIKRLDIGGRFQLEAVA